MNYIFGAFRKIALLTNHVACRRWSFSVLMKSLVNYVIVIGGNKIIQNLINIHTDKTRCDSSNCLLVCLTKKGGNNTQWMIIYNSTNIWQASKNAFKVKNYIEIDINETFV